VVQVLWVTYGNFAVDKVVPDSDGGTLGEATVRLKSALTLRNTKALLERHELRIDPDFGGFLECLSATILDYLVRLGVKHHGNLC